MKKLTALIFATILIMTVSAGFAEPSVIDGLTPREINIHEAGLNPSADEMIAQGISPTTGRELSTIKVPEGFLNLAETAKYQPVMVPADRPE